MRIKAAGPKLLAMMIFCLATACLTACQGGKSLAESCWDAARKESGLTKYIEKNWAALDKEGLRTEAETAETLSQQFKATALLCAIEQGDNGRTQDSPGAVLAREFFAKVLTQEDEFWKALEDAFYPYDCFDAMLAVAGPMDGEVIKGLLKGAPAEAKYADGLREAVDTWIEDNPISLSVLGDELNALGYFDGWSEQDWTQTYLYSYVDGDPVQAATIDEGLVYIGCLRDSMLPAMEGKFGTDEFKSVSDIDGETYYDTMLAVVVGEALSLQEPAAEDLPETIDIEGKKIIAFYRNPASAEWEGSPAPLRILGDFMLNLPGEAYPASAAEADYYLVLTPSYEYGSFYQDRTTGDQTGIQEVWSATSIDLYEAGTGNYLRHLGDVMEEASSSIVSHYGEEALEYPEVTSSDTLSYIYANVNTPETYVSLVDQTGGKVEYERDESVILGGWEVTYHSSQIVDSFEASLQKYEAGEGCKLVRAAFTLSNVGLKSETFMGLSIPGNGAGIQVGITDGTFESYIEPAQLWAYTAGLNNSSLDPGETEEGELVFEVPDSVLESAEGAYIVILYGYQMAIYPLGE